MEKSERKGVSINCCVCAEPLYAWPKEWEVSDAICSQCAVRAQDAMRRLQSLGEQDDAPDYLSPGGKVAWRAVKMGFSKYGRLDR